MVKHQMLTTDLTRMTMENTNGMLSNYPRYPRVIMEARYLKCPPASYQGERWPRALKGENSADTSPLLPMTDENYV